MEIVDSSAESLRLSAILKAIGFSLPFKDLEGKRVSHVHDISHIIKTKENEHEELTVGSVAEGIPIMLTSNSQVHSRSDSDTITVCNVFKIVDDIREVKYIKYIQDSNPKLSHFLRLPDYTNPGYSKLLVLIITDHLSKYCDIRDNNLFLKNTVKELLFVLEKKFQTKFTIHGPALSTDVSSWKSEFAFPPEDF
ncbi:unnamed protein product [Mytilus edulis]|uniref:Uncharacterized protein n=1 Tax=Mytilus edulis TaxID=6550 RepID=A0A8S3SMP6_MYTED|nr:unnamed protein product [Mytilus edulis]